MFVADSEGAARARAVGRCELRLMPALIREKGCCALSKPELWGRVWDATRELCVF